MLRAQGVTGVQTHVQQLFKYLAKDNDGADVALVTPFDWGRPLYLPIYASRHVLNPVNGSASVFWYRYWHEVFLRGALRRKLAALDDCVVYAQDPPSAGAALAARRHRGQRVVMAVHFRVSQADEWVDKGSIPRDGWAFRHIRAVDRSVIPRVDGIVYVSNWARDALIGWLPEAAAVPAAVIGNFVAPHHTAPGTGRHGDLVTVGNLEPMKNHRFLLEVLAAAKRSGRRYTLDVFGDGPLRNELQRLVDDLGLTEQVRFRGFRRDLRDFLPGYRAYVHASYSESSSLAIMEAMDAALPIVAANIGPIAELFDDGVEGRFWPLDDPEQAATILFDLLEDESKQHNAAQAAYKRFQRDYAADVVGPRLRSFLLGPAPSGNDRSEGKTVRHLRRADEEVLERGLAANERDVRVQANVSRPEK
jgi:glycosyltransferase involved in cell wall biosynthesis